MEPWRSFKPFLAGCRQEPLYQALYSITNSNSFNRTLTELVLVPLVPC
ncbi:hypothetical protein QQP08_015361 [Theobroma cacao]|nr:hypothetical protein QQP08_015361 [Theobroma cacao]